MSLYTSEQPPAWQQLFLVRNTDLPKSCNVVCHMIFLQMGIHYIICERSFKEMTSQICLKRKKKKKAEIFLMARNTVQGFDQNVF